ncbi:MAG: uridylate kinase [Clostridia bacterium]|nr:uridylate kinase [Clostridia bacterium]
MADRIELVIKIGSMALIRREDNDIDYNLFSRLGGELRPGMLLVSSGATEIGRLDYWKRTGTFLTGDPEENKTDYSAQGQAILMETYRRFIKPEYSVRQVLVEHNHFNDPQKRRHLYQLLTHCAGQNAIPIINYNDAVSDEENRKLELQAMQRESPARQVVECVDNDETAAVVAELTGVSRLVLLTSADGIYQDPSDPQTLVRDVCYPDAESLTAAVRALQDHCVGASRAGANGAGAKLEYALRSALLGTEVIIASAKKYRLHDILNGDAPCTRIGITK